MAASDRPLTSALTGVFAPGSAPLMETLRTLVVTPRRTVSPGEVIRAEFAFSNLGGAPATGVHVRFANPSGVTYVEASDTVDDAPLADESLTANGGALVGDLPSGAQRRVACSFRVNDRIEDGSELIFQAALITDQTVVVASNVVRLKVRSEPQLQNSSTLVTIAAADQLKPGDLITVRATITNAGSSSAHQVHAFLPVPPHAEYVSRSARVAGRALMDAGDEPFDYGTEHVIAHRLAPGQSVELEYQATIDSPLADGTRIKVIGAIASRETAEFPVQSAEIVITSPPNFINDDTALTIFCDDVVSPGTRVPISVRALNAGTGDAQNVSIGIDLPPGIAYTPGSAHLDGQPVSDESFAGATFSLRALPPGRMADVGISGIVIVQGREELPVTASVRWKGGERRFTRALRVRVSSRFTRARNYIEADRAVVHAREDVTFTVHVFNDGTAVEADVQLRVIPGASLENVRIAESPEEPVAYCEPFVLGVVQPQVERTFTVRVRVSSPVPDRAQITLGAVLEFASGTFDLGVANLVVRSRPHVHRDACSWMRTQSEALRPGNTHEIAIRFTNDGADVLQEARLELSLPPELILERAQNARRDGNALLFGDIAAETTHEACVAVRLLRAPRIHREVEIEGNLSGRGISRVQFEPLELPTFAEPAFEQDAQLRSNPAESIKAGERVAYEVHLRNSGDGPAERVVVRAIPSSLAVYIPGTTQLNGMPIPDELGTSQLWSQRGLLLTDVNPDVELRVRWEMLVISPVAEGTEIETRAVVEWDGDRSIGLAEPVLRVTASPLLEAGDAGTPISVAQLQPSIEVARAETIVPPEPAVEPVVAEPTAQVPKLTHDTPVVAARPALYLDFSQEQLPQTVRMLERTDAGGLIPHLFAVQAFLPNSLAGSDARTAQTIVNAVRAVRAPLERFFVRLGAPRLSITAKDLEDRDSRLALRELLGVLSVADTAEPTDRPAAVVRLSGEIDASEVFTRAAELESAPLGSASPWIVGATLLGTRIEYNHAGRSGALRLYRSELIKVFGVLERLPMPEFHRVLTSSVNRILDDALRAVLDDLRAAAQIVVS